jgi:hypothetical protein
MQEPKTALMTFDDQTFQKLILGDKLELEIRPNTTKIVVALDPRSKYRKTYMEVLDEAIRTKDRGRLLNIR